MKGKKIMAVGAMACFLAVAIGAFGTHALADLLTEGQRVDTFETAVKYQFYHGLALLLLGMLRNRYKGEKLTAAAWLFVSGIVVFSGSLYVLCLTDIRIMGAITPFGGALFLAGWAVFGIFIWTYKSTR